MRKIENLHFKNYFQASQRKIRRGSTDCSPRSDTSSGSSTSPGVINVVDKRCTKSASKHRINDSKKTFGSSQTASALSEVRSPRKSHHSSSTVISERKLSRATSLPKVEASRKSENRSSQLTSALSEARYHSKSQHSSSAVTSERKLSRATSLPKVEVSWKSENRSSQMTSALSEARSHSKSQHSSSAATSERKLSRATSLPKVDTSRKSENRGSTSEKPSNKSKRERSKSSERHGGSSQSKRHKSSHHKRDASPLRRRHSVTAINQKSTENKEAKSTSVPESVVELPRPHRSAEEKKILTKSETEHPQRKRVSSGDKVESKVAKKPEHEKQVGPKVSDGDRKKSKAVQRTDTFPGGEKIAQSCQVKNVQSTAPAKTAPAPPSTPQSHPVVQDYVDDVSVSDDDDDVNYEYDEEGLKQLEQRLLHLYRHRQKPQPEVATKTQDDSPPWLRPLDLKDIFRPPPMINPFDVIATEDILAFKVNGRAGSRSRL